MKSIKLQWAYFVLIFVLVSSIQAISLENLGQASREQLKPNYPSTSLARKASDLKAPFSDILTASSSKDPQPNLSWIFVAFPLIAVAGLLAYVETKRKKNHIELESQRRQNTMASLRQYVENAMQKGYRKDQIVDALMKNNHSRDDIEQAFNVKK